MPMLSSVAMRWNETAKEKIKDKLQIAVLSHVQLL